MSPRPRTRVEKFVNDAPTLPSWWPLFTVLAAVVLGVVLLISAISGPDTNAPVAANRPAPPAPTAAPSNPGTPSPAASAPATGATVTMTLPDGTTVQVPGAAKAVASAAALALYTGDYTGVNVVGPAPSATRVPGAAPSILGVDLTSASPTAYTFAARVHTDPSNPSAVATVTVSTQLANGSWGYVPAQVAR